MDNQNPQSNTPPANEPMKPASTPPDQPPPSTPPAQPSAKLPSQPSYILFIAIGVLVVIAVLGVLFVMGIKKGSTPPVAIPTPQAVKTQVTVPPSVTPVDATELTLSSSDELNALEKDAASTAPDSLDNETTNLSKEAESL